VVRREEPDAEATKRGGHDAHHKRARGRQQGGNGTGESGRCANGSMASFDASEGESLSPE
jgi:hypothetical protein